MNTFLLLSGMDALFTHGAVRDRWGTRRSERVIGHMRLGWFYGPLTLSDIYFGLVYKPDALSDACTKFVY